MKKIIFLSLLLFLWTVPARADIEYWKVVEVAGLVETRSPLEPGWKSLSAPFYMKKGSLLRTGKDAWVDLSLNRQWDGFLRLNADSELEFPENTPEAVRLRRGSLFALLEGEAEGDLLSVFSPGATVRLVSGGAAVSTLASGTRLRVFSETAEIAGVSQSIEEGWEWDAGNLRRMEFADYDDWQKWIRKSYDRKDKYFLKRSV